MIHSVLNNSDITVIFKFKELCHIRLAYRRDREREREREREKDMTASNDHPISA